MTRIQPRRGLASDWTSTNPVLAIAELGYETDTKRAKRGDGATQWSALPYEKEWSTLPGKPAVVAAGADAASARASITVDRARLFNVKDYGATGNGTADDTTFIQAAIDAAGTAGGGQVYLPIGQYKLTNTLTIRSGVELSGAGPLSALVPNFPTSSPNRVVDNDWINGSNSITLRNFKLDRTNALLCHGMLFNGVNGLLIDGIEISGGPATATGAGAIAVSGVGPTTRLLSKDVRVVNCRLDDVGNYGVQVSYVDGCVIANNTAINSYREVFAAEPEVSCTARNVVISGNTVIGSSTANGSSTGLIIATTNSGGVVDGISITGNVLRQISGGNTGNSGIDINGGSGVVISGNSVQNMDGAGIAIGINGYGITEGVVCQGNTVLNCSQNGSGSFPGIWFKTAKHCSVVGNYVYGVNHSAGVTEFSNSENNLIALNVLRDTIPTVVVHVGTTVFGNKITDDDQPFRLGSNDTVSPTLTINGTASGPRRIDIQSAGVNRWRYEVSGTETGSSAGSDMQLIVRDDTGASAGLATTWKRKGRRMVVGGSFARHRQTTATSYTATTSDQLVAVTDTSAARTITLPSVASLDPGGEIIIKDESGGAATNNITIATVNSETIQGAATIVISSNYGVVHLCSTSTGWVVLHNLTLSSTDTLTNKTLTSPVINTPTISAAALTGTSAVAQSGEFHLHNQTDQVTNYERARAYWTGNVFTLGSEKGGTGTLRPIQLVASGSLTLYGASISDGAVLMQQSTSSAGCAIGGAKGTLSAASGAAQVGFKVAPTITQSGSASYAALLVSTTETTIGSGTQRLADLQVGSVSKFYVDNAGNTFLTGGLDVGNATDATITRSAAGVVAVEGFDVVTKSVVSLTSTTTLSAVPSREYVYLLGVGALPTLPTAVGNTSIYNVKNTTGSAINLASTSSQTFDGVAGPLSISAQGSVTLASNNANWVII